MVHPKERPPNPHPHPGLAQSMFSTRVLQQGHMCMTSAPHTTTTTTTPQLRTIHIISGFYASIFASPKPSVSFECLARESKLQFPSQRISCTVLSPIFLCVPLIQAAAADRLNRHAGTKHRRPPGIHLQQDTKSPEVAQSTKQGIRAKQKQGSCCDCSIWSVFYKFKD